MTGKNTYKRGEIAGYLTGYLIALALTGVAFAMVQWRIFAPGPTLAFVLGLALIQVIVHFRFFLHIRFDRSSRDGLYLLLFSALIIFLMVSGTLVVMISLRDRMMM